LSRSLIYFTEVWRENKVKFGGNPSLETLEETIKMLGDELPLIGSLLL
jgi:hypothetical protein